MSFKFDIQPVYGINTKWGRHTKAKAHDNKRSCNTVFQFSSLWWQSHIFVIPLTKLFLYYLYFLKNVKLNCVRRLGISIYCHMKLTQQMTSQLHWHFPWHMNDVWCLSKFNIWGLLSHIFHTSIDFHKTEKELDCCLNS